jgi:predicted O-methyltransferase YrrM
MTLSSYLSLGYQEAEVFLKKTLANNQVPSIHIDWLEAHYLYGLVTKHKPNKILEIGTLFGFSTYFLAKPTTLYVPCTKESMVYCCEKSPFFAKLAIENWETVGLTDRIQVFVGSALDTLQNQLQDKYFDCIFIDADKQNYPHYVVWAIEHIRPGGHIILDNCLGFGHNRIGLDTEPVSTTQLVGFLDGIDSKQSMIQKNLACIHQANQILIRNPNFHCDILPFGDGLLVAYAKN